MKQQAPDAISRMEINGIEETLVDDDILAVAFDLNLLFSSCEAEDH